MFPQVCSRWACFLFMSAVIIAPVMATVHDLVQVIDLSNLDLPNFEYFKNFPSQNPRSTVRVSPVLEHFQRKKAVLDYFEHLFFGLSPFTQESAIPFDPHYGRAWQPHFERKYGRRGERLVEALGNGHSLEQLKRYGAIPEEFGRIYYPAR